MRTWVWILVLWLTTGMSSGKWLNLAKLECPTIQNEKNNSFFTGLLLRWASQVALVVKNPPANAGDIRDVSLIPRLGRFPGGGHGNPLQYSCLENPMDRAAWWATVHSVTRSQTPLEWLSMHALLIYCMRITEYREELSVYSVSS